MASVPNRVLLVHPGHILAAFFRKFTSAREQLTRTRIAIHNEPQSESQLGGNRN